MGNRLYDDKIRAYTNYLAAKGRSLSAKSELMLYTYPDIMSNLVQYHQRTNRHLFDVIDDFFSYRIVLPLSLPEFPKASHSNEQEVWKRMSPKLMNNTEETTRILSESEPPIPQGSFEKVTTFSDDDTRELALH